VVVWVAQRAPMLLPWLGPSYASFCFASMLRTKGEQQRGASLGGWAHGGGEVY